MPHLKLHSTLQIAELLQGLFQELPNIQSKSVQQAISQATLALGEVSRQVQRS